MLVWAQCCAAHCNSSALGSDTGWFMKPESPAHCLRHTGGDPRSPHTQDSPGTYKRTRALIWDFITLSGALQAGQTTENFTKSPKPAWPDPSPVSVHHCFPQPTFTSWSSVWWTAMRYMHSNSSFPVFGRWHVSFMMNYRKTQLEVVKYIIFNAKL